MRGMSVRVLRHLVTLWLVLICAMPFDASAQSSDGAQLTTSQKKEAKRHFLEGSRAFESKDFAAAIDSFRQAYDIVHLPEIIYNIGRCYEELGQIDDALYHYEMYLRFYPTAEDAEDTRHRIAMLQELKQSGSSVTTTSSSDVASMEELSASEDKKKRSKVDRAAALKGILASKVRLGMGLGGAMGFGIGDYYNANKFGFLPFDVFVTLRLSEKLGAFLSLDYARYAEGKASIVAVHIPVRRIGGIVGLRWLVPVGKLAVDLSVGGFADYVQFNHPVNPGWYGGRLTGGISVPVSASWSFLASALFSLGVLHSTATAGETALQGEAGARLGFEYAF